VAFVFAPQCASAKATRPILYWVDTVVGLEEGETGQPSREAGTLSSLPRAVMSKFDETLDASLRLLVIRTAQQSAKQGNTLFMGRHRVDKISYIPGYPVLSAGDVAVLYDHTPPYDLNPTGSILWPPDSDEAKWSRDLAKKAYNKYITGLKETSTAKINPPPEGKPVEPGAMGAASSKSFQTVKVKFKSGAEKWVYHWEAFATVNIASAISKAFFVFAGVRKGPPGKLFDFIKAGEFSIAALNDANSKQLTTPAFLEAVGRGLAYDTLHEFWHVTTPDNPEPHWLGEGNNIIEGVPDPAKVSKSGQPLTLTQKSVDAILKRYDEIWCGSLKKGALNANDF
jgi:hypothetical protein